MEEIKSFEINKIYHITLDSDYFGDNSYQLDYENFNTNDLIHIHLIDRDNVGPCNIIIFFNNLTNDNICCYANNSKYYFHYDNVGKCFKIQIGV